MFINIINNNNSWNNSSWYEIGCKLVREERYAEAISYLDKAISQNPRFAYALAWKGTALYKLARYSEAITYFDKVIQLNSGEATANGWLGKGEALRNLERYEESIRCFDEAIKLNSKFVEPWYNKGLALDAQRKYDEAIRCYDEAIKLNPKYEKAWNDKGSALYAQEKYDEAIRCYNEALNLCPKHEHAWNGKANALRDQGKLDEAICCYNEALNLNPKHEYAWNNKGNALYAQGKHDQAIRCYDEAIKLNPKYENAWNNKGNAFRDQGKLDEAIRCYDEAIKLNSKNVDYWNLKGFVLSDQGKHDEAIRCYDEAIKLNPKYETAWNNKGNVLRDQGKLDEALRCYDEAISLDPKDEFALNNKGQTLFFQKNYTEASKHFEQALVINSNFATAVQSKGVELFRQGHTSAAFKLFEQAEQLAIKNGNSSLAYLLHRRGQLLFFIEANELAKVAFEKALTLRPELKSAQQDLDKVLKVLLTPKPALPKPPTLQAKALYDYSASAYEELSFQAGDVLEVLSQNSSGWWRCCLASKEGLVPSTFVELLSNAPAVNKSLPSSPKVSMSTRNLPPSNFRGSVSSVAKIDAPATIPASKQTPGWVDTSGNIKLSLTIPYADLTVGSVIGEGGFGKVYKGSWRHMDVAIKKLHVQQLSEETLKEFKQESTIMARLRCPFIIQLYGISLNPYCMIMEYAENGSLYSYLHSDKPLMWSTRIQIAQDMAKGLAFLHHEKILHRDIKSHNVLLDDRLHAKLADFGLSKLKTETSSSTKHDSVGTLMWMAPELFQRRATYTQACDIYSYGITLWEVASRKLPFADAQGNQSLIKEWVKEGEREDIPGDCPERYGTIVKQCWDSNASLRPTASRVIELLKDVAELESPQITVPSPSASSHLESTHSSTSASQSSLGSYKNNLNSGPVTMTSYSSAFFSSSASSTSSNAAAKQERNNFN